MRPSARCQGRPYTRKNEHRPALAAEPAQVGEGRGTPIHDGIGNRVAKTVGGVTTQYLVDDLNPTGYPQVFDELTGGTVTRAYTSGLQRISENQIVNSAWTPSFYGFDGFGTVRQLTNLSGTVTDTYEYDAFGNEITHTGTTPNDYLYRGEQYDSDLGLYYLRARYYNPLTGRFMSRDPENGNSLDPASLHKYLYANGDPLDKTDPRGRAATEYSFLQRFLLIPVIDAAQSFPVAGQIATAFGFVAYVNCVLLGAGDFLYWVATGFKEGFLPSYITQPCYLAGLAGGVGGALW